MIASARRQPVFIYHGYVPMSPLCWYLTCEVPLLVSFPFPAGSAGDMLMMRKVVFYSRGTRFEDTGDGFVAYGAREDRLDKPYS